MGRKIPQETWDQFDVLVGKRGYSISKAAKELGIGRTAASEHVKGRRLAGKDYAKEREQQKNDEIPDPVAPEDLNENAQRAVEDFSFFRYHYLGRQTKPWQENAAHELKELLLTPHDEYVVMNEPPGSGKSTTFTHDLPAWLVIGNRRLRAQIGSKTTRQAKYYTLHLRRTLERPYPMQDAQGCIARDFGRFKPDSGDLWRADEFIVEQHEGEAIDVKEPTVQAISQEMGFLGARADFIVWDDLVDYKNSRSTEARENLQDFWTSMAETRLEPGGVLILQGQRLGPDDLYHYALEMLLGDEDPDEVDEEARAALPRKYHHIIYPAHFEERCQNDHGKQAKAWPEGCLLDPERLSWRKLSTIKANDPGKYETVYQQKDTAPGTTLVQDIWLEGGRDVTTGEEYPGCYDLERDICELPAHANGAKLSVITADPSPANWWSVQWWVYHFPTEERFLMDHHRAKMGANDFLDRLQDGTYVGVAHEWAQRARRLSLPFTHLIVERNAAQKFLMQYDFFQQWLRRTGIILVPHDTSTNKADPQFGVQTIGQQYRLGRVRLPWKPGSYGRRASQPLVTEAKAWPQSSTEDCVMAQWFLEWNLRNLTFQSRRNKKASHRPSWIGRASSPGMARV